MIGGYFVSGLFVLPLPDCMCSPYYPTACSCKATSSPSVYLSNPDDKEPFHSSPISNPDEEEPFHPSLSHHSRCQTRGSFTQSVSLAPPSVALTGTGWGAETGGRQPADDPQMSLTLPLLSLSPFPVPHFFPHFIVHRDPYLFVRPAWCWCIFVFVLFLMC